MKFFDRIRRLFQISLLSLLLLSILVGAAIGMYRMKDPWKIVLTINEGSQPYSLAMTADGKRIALGANYEIELWDVESGKKLAERPDNGVDMVVNLRYTPDERSLLYGGVHYNMST